MNNPASDKKLYENSLMNQIGRELGLSQSQAQQFCRNNVEAICMMYNDGYSASECQKYLVSFVENVDELKDQLPRVFSGW